MTVPSQATSKELVGMDLKEDIMEKDEKDAVLPAFLSKTFEIFSTPHFSSICGWNTTGDTIIIHDPDVFVKQVLPRFFKHRNLPSFVRQLNMYGFHKSVLDSNKREFRHKMFLRDKPELLRYIKRKVNTTNLIVDVKRDELSQEILNEMKNLKMKNEIMEKRLRDIEIDNAIVRNDNIKLWKQLETAKEKQMIMQEKMKKILWVLFQIYRGKQNHVPTISSDTNSILTEELINGSSRLGSKEFRDVLRFLAMDDAPLLEGMEGNNSTTNDKLQLPKNGKKRKFVEVPTLNALPAPTTTSINTFSPVLQDQKMFEILESSPQRIPKTIKPKKLKENQNDTALSLFTPPPNNFMPYQLEKSHSLDTSNDLTTDLIDDDLILADDSLNFSEVESENVMKKLEDFESSLLNEYDVTCLDNLLKQINAPEKITNQVTK